MLVLAEFILGCNIFYLKSELIFFKPIHTINFITLGTYMDYTGAERLKQALEKLERVIQSGGNIAGEGQSVDTEALSALQAENDALKYKQLEISEELDTIIATVESALKEENAA